MFKDESGRISAGAALAVFIIGVIAIVGAAVLLVVRPGLKKNDNTVSANVVPFAARLERLDGEIGIAQPNGDQQDQPYQGWSKATVNAPVSLGDRIYVRDGSKAAIAINRHNHIRLNSGTSLDVLSLSEGHTQLALREGACVFDVGSLASDEIFEVGTPSGAIDFTQPGLYQVGIDDGGDTVVSVLNGLARVSGLAGSGEVSKGQLLTLAAAAGAQAVISALSPDVAGTIVNDYYEYRYPNVYDGRYADYHIYEEDPYYYDQSYRRTASYQYVSEDAELAGLEDLDDYGEWRDVPNYGHCWHPRASADWAPYRDGYWTDDYPLGLTWVSNEQWGWAPYHYGRWAHVEQEWYWVPAEIERRTVYAPALVAFVSLPRPDEIGWVPLGPGDPYVSRYYDQDYQPRYVGSRSDIDRYLNVTTTVNYSDPAAVTVVSVNQFTKVITPETVLRTEPNQHLNTRPIVDAFSVPYVRQIAPTIEASRPAVVVPIEVQQSANQPVMVRQQPVATNQVATNIAETLKVQPVPETAAKQKLKVKDIGQAVTSTQPNGLPAVPPEAKQSQQTNQEREARIAELAPQAAQGNKAAKREMRQLEQQQRHELKAERKAAEQQAPAQQPQPAEQQKAEKRAARQQAQQAEQQRQAQTAQQAEQQKAQKRAARQQAQQAAQQAEQQRQAQTAQQAEQQKAQKRAARQQAAQQAEQQRQAQAAQQAEQQKGQKRAARQQAQQAAQQAEQQRQAQAAQQAEQQKAQKQAARQQAAQQQAQQEAARQQAQQEQRRIQKQAQQQAQEQAQKQRQQEKVERRTQRPNTEQPPAQASPAKPAEANPAKAERKAEKGKNKNKNKNSGQ